MNNEKQLEIAAAALPELEALHEQFMAAISELKKPGVNGAEFSVADSEIQCNCLGIRLKTRHKLIARDGEFAGIEYTFLAGNSDEWNEIWSLYLLPTKRLYADSTGQDVICDMSNQYLPTRVAPPLAAALMASKIFSPRA